MVTHGVTRWSGNYEWDYEWDYECDYECDYGWDYEWDYEWDDGWGYDCSSSGFPSSSPVTAAMPKAPSKHDMRTYRAGLKYKQVDDD